MPKYTYIIAGTNKSNTIFCFESRFLMKQPECPELFVLSEPTEKLNACSKIRNKIKYDPCATMADIACS